MCRGAIGSTAILGYSQGLWAWGEKGPCPLGRRTQVVGADGQRRCLPSNQNVGGSADRVERHCQRMWKGTTMSNSQVLLGITILSITFAGACSDNGVGKHGGGGAQGGSSGVPGTGGDQGGGGSSNFGGVTAGSSDSNGTETSGGAPATGGAIDVGGITGGGPNSSGGSPVSGGATSTGQVTSPGGSAGGTIGRGGATGGVIANGGGAGGRGGATGGAIGGSMGGGPGGRGGAGGVAGAVGGTTGAGGVTGGAKGGTTGAGGPTGSTGGAKGGSGGSALPSGPALAFPGAVGFGKNATGGRGYAVYHVTNLNDTGAGSFRDAVSAGNRIIVFDVGGYVNMASTIAATSSNITIAGQTAPGDGIGFKGYEVSFNGAKNVIVRYVRFRQGLIDSDWRKSGINLLNGSNMIFDHISIEFAQYNNIDAVGATNITMQYTINANPTHQQFCAHTEMTGGFFTWYGNLLANAHGRMPLAKCNTQFVNNVIYNYQYAYCAGDTSGIFWHDLVNNYFIAGPSTNSVGNYFYQLNTGQTIYVSGNLADTNKDGTLNGTDPGSPGGTTKASKANSGDTASLPTTSAAATYADVLANAGAWPKNRDQVDSLVVADVKSLGKSGQMWTDQNATGLTNSGYGTLAGGTAPVDTDKDGMPDAWETKYGLNPNDPADATGDFDKTGYTNIEKYINGIVDGLYP